MFKVVKLIIKTFYHFLQVKLISQNQVKYIQFSNIGYGPCQGFFRV